MNQVAHEAQSAGSAGLSFEELRLPRDVARVRVDADELASVLSVLLGDAACSEAGEVAAYAAQRGAQTALLAPCLRQTLSLPVRLGEKVLWAQNFPGIRLTPFAQRGVACEAEALALLTWLRRTAPGQAVVLTDVAIDSPLYAAVLKAGGLGYRLTKNEPDAHLFHRFGESYAEFFNQRGSKYKNQLRKKEKVFAERFGNAFEFKEYRRPEEVQEFLSAAKAINQKTYQFRMFGESVDDDEHSVAAARRAALAGGFRSFVLWHGQTPLCFVLGHQRADGTFEHQQTGYDPEYRDAAPGIFSNILLLQRLYATDKPVLMDFGNGDSDYKRLFSTESRQTASPVLLPRRPRFMLAYGLFEASAAFNGLIVKWLDRLGLKAWIKRRLRGAT